jgi:hypothetical protein
MRLKRYLQFINESLSKNSTYWIDDTQIKDIFQHITDEGYELSVVKVLFGYYGYSNNKFYDPNKNPESDKLIKFDTSREDVVLSGESYSPGYRIEIFKSQYKGSDVTDEFQSAISQLKGEGYIVDTIEDEDGKTNIENIHLISGSIITWIPETPNKPFTTNQKEMVDGDIYISSAELILLVHQTDEVKLTDKMLAEIYNWTCDRIEGDRIYCHVEIDDMARAILSSNDYKRWTKILESGQLDIDDYYGDGYYPEISSMFQYTLDKDNRFLLVKALIQELGGLEATINNLIDEDNTYESLVGKSEDEVIDFLLKERFLNGVKKLSQDSEIIGTVRETIADWERQAHCDQNWNDLISEFDEVVSNVTDKTYGQEYTKLEKEVEKYYTKKDTNERVYYKTMVTHYELPFQDKWILEYGKSLKGCSLDSLFIEWCSDDYTNYELKPNFKDWGDVDSKDLNREIASILNYNLKSA